MKKLILGLSQAVFGLYMLLVFAILLISLFPFLLILPRLAWRRSMASALSSLVFFLCGMKLTIRGLENLPATACVIVANHASYLDGVILTAALPPDFAFVIKREVTQVPFVHYLLKSIGSEFVERNHSGGKTRDSRRLLRKAASGLSMVFFPEGTFRLEPGLLPFHNGAFTAAVRGRLPLVPVIIRGARRILPAKAFWPRWGRIEVEMLAALDPPGTGVGGQHRLKEAARLAMQAKLGEPLVEKR